MPDVPGVVAAMTEAVAFVKASPDEAKKTQITYLGLPEAVSQWIAERTRQAPRAGSAEATLPYTSSRDTGRGRAEGRVKATLSWRFEEL